MNHSVYVFRPCLKIGCFVFKISFFYGVKKFYRKSVFDRIRQEGLYSSFIVLFTIKAIDSLPPSFDSLPPLRLSMVDSLSLEGVIG